MVTQALTGNKVPSLLRNKLHTAQAHRHTLRHTQASTHSEHTSIFLKNETFGIDRHRRSFSRDWWHLSTAMEVREDVVDESGIVFNLRYALRARLGHGCSATVFSARDLASGDSAAVKLAQWKPKIKWPLVVQVFRNEAVLLQRCVHPNIVGFHGLYEGRDEIALVLQLVDGSDCQNLLQRHGCLAEPAVGAIVHQLCEALRHMHGLGVLHRDVKLENILVCSTERMPRIKLCDFGHSCDLAKVDQRDHFFGTKAYASPEVLSGPQWSEAADIWSLGACMCGDALLATPATPATPAQRPPPAARALAHAHGPNGTRSLAPSAQVRATGQRAPPLDRRRARLFAEYL